jgi:hypothetical protein
LQLVSALSYLLLHVLHAAGYLVQLLLRSLSCIFQAVPLLQQTVQLLMCLGVPLCSTASEAVWQLHEHPV